MNCIEAKQNWMLYLDGEVEPELQSCIRDHLGKCSDCSGWFAKQQQVEKRIDESLSAGSLTPQLWQRITSNLKNVPAVNQRKRRRVFAIALTAAAILLFALMAYQIGSRARPNEWARNAANWHEQWQCGNIHPDLNSNSDIEVDRYLKAKVPFRVHCPPRTDVDFAVAGAGVCFMKDHRQAAYIVGSVGKNAVSILVLDRANLQGYPTNGFNERHDGGYQVASRVIADNVVIVVGSATPDILNRLLNAYDTYPDG